jgi:hypothetical protein
VYGMLLSFWGASNPTPSVASVKFPIIYVMDVQIIMIKRVYGLSGCHGEGLAFLVRPEFLLDVGSLQGVSFRLGRH